MTTLFGKKAAPVTPVVVKKAYEIICPYCFKRYPPNQVVFRINYDIPGNESFKRKPDEKLNIYRRKINLEEVMEIEAVIDPVANSNLVKYRDERDGLLLGITDINGEYTNTRLCPHCHKDLPITSGKGPTQVISVIGGTSVGKTVYMTILLNTLQSSTAMNFGAGCIPTDSQYLEIINENEDMLYYNGEVLPPSPKETRIEPLVLSFSFENENKAPVTLIFYDVAGEGMKDPQYIKKHATNIENSTGIMFLVDPLQINSIEEKIKIMKNLEDNLDISKGITTSDMRTRPMRRLTPDKIITILFQAFIGHGIKIKSDIPTAVIISKSDMLDVLEGSDINGNSNIFKNYKHKDKLNLKQISIINKEVEDFIMRVDPSFNNALKVFTNRQFFAVSALGSNPINRKITEAISPLRVDEPFLWLLHKWGFIEGDNTASQ